MFTPQPDDVIQSGNHASVQREHGADKVNLALSRPHLSPTHIGSMSLARDTILSAVETLELENSKLQQINEKMVAEVASLRQENSLLRQQLNSAKLRCERLEKDNELLEDELREQRRLIANESDKFVELESSLKRECETRRRECETTRRDLEKRDCDCRKLVRQLDELKEQLERSRRRLVEQNDVELFHELQMLKAECKDLTNDRDRTLKANKKLGNEMEKLRISLEEKLSELRNENRRHSLLTKEFNSLLEENNHLKLQLRRGGQLQRTAAEDTAVATETVVAEFGANAKSNASATRPKNFSYSTSLSRDSSATPSSEILALARIRRERTTLSGHRTRITRRGSSVRQDSDYRNTVSRQTIPTGERRPSQSRADDRRVPVAITRSTASRSDSDCSQSPESLPSISGSKTWRP